MGILFPRFNNMWVDIKLIKDAEKVIEVYGLNTLTGQFAKEIIDANEEPFGVYAEKLVSDPLPSFKHITD